MESQPKGTYSREVLEDLLDGKLDWTRLKQMMSAPKDAERFERTLAILQQRVPWRERILLPLTEHLYIVEKDTARVVKCDCGHEFGDYRENWKLKALIHVRDTNESLEELYLGPRKPDPKVCEIREFCCPGCGTQLEVEAVPRGYPILFDFLPDIDAFYQQWLKNPLERATACEDRTYRLTEQWSRKEDV